VQIVPRQRSSGLRQIRPGLCAGHKLQRTAAANHLLLGLPLRLQRQQARNTRSQLPSTAAACWSKAIAAMAPARIGADTGQFDELRFVLRKPPPNATTSARGIQQVAGPRISNQARPRPPSPPHHERMLQRRPPHPAALREMYGNTASRAGMRRLLQHDLNSYPG